MHEHTLEPSDLYGAYRHALDETESALADWWSAAVARRREAYAIYRAAAEREHAARSEEHTSELQSPFSLHDALPISMSRADPQHPALDRNPDHARAHTGAERPLRRVSPRPRRDRVRAGGLVERGGRSAARGVRHLPRCRRARARGGGRMAQGLSCLRHGAGAYSASRWRLTASISPSIRATSDSVPAARA